MSFNFNEVFERIMTILQLQTVVILSHVHPDGDAAGTVMALAHYIKDVYPQYNVLPFLSEDLDKGPKKFLEKETEFEPFVEPSIEKPYAVIVSDTANTKRMTGLSLFQKAEISMVIDHHLSNEKYGDFNYIDISEACAENVFYMLDWGRWTRTRDDAAISHLNAADYLYMGILHDTGGFQRAQRSTMEAAAKLIGLGVQHGEIIRTMQTETLSSLRKRGMLFDRTQTVMNGKVLFLIVRKNLQYLGDFTYEDVHPISNYLRDVDGVEVAFTMFEENTGVWKCSFRSKKINVTELLKPYGGGGHEHAASLWVEASEPEKLVEDIIREVKQEIERRNL